FFFSSRRRHTRLQGDWSSDVCSSDLECRLVAVIGDDARGDSFRGELAQSRLIDSHLVVVAARPTTSKTRVTARGQQLVRIDEERSEERRVGKECRAKGSNSNGKNT